MHLGNLAKRIFITVGEASGDQHAAHLIRELRQIDPTLVIEGLGGPKMAEAGATVHRDTVHGAAMGWEGALRYLELKRLLWWSGRYFRESPPDLQICIDSWSMNWHWAKLAHGLNVPVFYYITPQMWASRPWRVKKMKRYVDRVACILPFEEKFFKDRGVDATFVGHPIFDALVGRWGRGAGSAVSRSAAGHWNPGWLAIFSGEKEFPKSFGCGGSHS